MQRLIKIIYELFRDDAERIINETADFIEKGFRVSDVILMLQRNYLKAGEFIIIRDGCIGCNDALKAHPGMKALNYELFEEYLRSSGKEIVFPVFIVNGEIWEEQ